MRPDPTAFAEARVAAWNAHGLDAVLRGACAGPDGVAIRDLSSRAGAEAVEVVRFNLDGLVRDSAAFYE